MVLKRAFFVERTMAPLPSPQFEGLSLRCKTRQKGCACGWQWRRCMEAAGVTMKRYLVTGGAGFIGSAVARKLIRDTSHQVLVVDKLTYAGNLDSLDSGIEQHALPLREGRYRRRRADAHAHRCVPAGRHHAPRRGEPCRSLDRRAGSVRADERRRHLRPACRPPCTIGGACLASASGLSASTTSRPTRCSARSAMTGSSTRNIPISRLRPIRPRRPLPTISSAPGTIPTACRRSSPTARTTTARITFPRS